MRKALKQLFKILGVGSVVILGLGGVVYVSSAFLNFSEANEGEFEPVNPFWNQKPILVAQNEPPPPPPPEDLPPLPPEGDAALGEQQGNDQEPPPPEVSNSGEDFELFLEPYNYDPSGRRDPFVRIENLEADMVAGEQSRPLLPLERYDLVDIQLIGIIWSVKNPRAMFLDPENQVHILAKDERIGRNQGYIAVVREGEVIVVESTEKSGEVVYQTKIMRIRKEQL